jgi:hypothetical protein
MGVNDIKKEELFRDSKKWYLNKVGYVSPQLIDFSVKPTLYCKTKRKGDRNAGYGCHISKIFR